MVFFLLLFVASGAAICILIDFNRLDLIIIRYLLSSFSSHQIKRITLNNNIIEIYTPSIEQQKHTHTQTH